MPSRVVQEGWLLKRSKTLHVWRRRWASLWEDENDGRSARLLFSPEAKMYQETSEIFHLSQILSVCEAQLDSERSHCFVLQHQETSSSVRLVGLQAADAESLNQWLTALRRREPKTPETARVKKDLPTLLESSPISAAHVADVACHAAGSSTEGTAGNDKGPSGKGSKGCAKVGKGKGKASKGPAIPALPKGKGKGPPLPGPSGESSGKGKGKAQPKPLLFGKRLNLRDSGALPETARGEQPQENIFQGLLRERAGRTQEDIDTLHSYFQPKTSGRSEGRPTTPGSSGRGSMVGTPRAVFTDSVARNCAIVLRKLALKGMDLVKAVELLEPGPLDQDQLDRLAKVMPDQEKMAQLKLASSQKEQLRDVEQAMVPFAHLGRLQERLKALTLAANVQPNEQTFLTQLKTVSAACQEICDSHSLKNVLAIVLLMYNYVNFGQVERTDARAFDIANLLQLNDFRSDKGGPFPRFSALHYVALRLLKETPQSVRSLQEELGQVQEAAGICLSSVEVWIKELKSGIQELLEEQRANAQVYGGQEPTPTPPAPPAALAPASPGPGRRGSMLSEVTEGTDDEHITPRTSRIELPQQTPRCGARMAVWLRTQLGSPKPLELGELARGMPQQCLDPDELHLSFEGRDPKKASVSISNLGLLYIRELEMENSVKAVPIIGSDVSLVSSPSFGEAIFEVAYSATPRLRRRLVLKANELTAACRWQRALKDAAAADGSGWLKVQNSFGFFRWTWATLLTVPLGRASEVSLGSLLLQPGSRWLVWFKTPEELLQGNVAGGVELAGTEVFSTDPRRFTFAVAHVRRERSTGREQMKQLVLRSGTDEDMKRWMTALRRPVQEPKPGPSPGRGASQRSIQSDATSGGGRQRIAVPRLNLGGSAETSSARSKASSTSTEYTSPLKEKAKAKTKDTLWTEIHRDIITPRPSMTQNAPRIVDRCLEDDSSTESESESDSGSTSDSTTSTVSVGAAPAAPAPAAPLREPLSRRALTARAGNEEVTSFSRMSALAAEAEASATLLRRHLTDTLEDGKKLLIFLGQKPPTEPAELAVKVRSVFDTIAKFVSQFKCAAADVEKFQKKSKGGTTFNGENLGFYRRKKAEMPKAIATSTAPVATPPTAQCKRLARDCVMHALFRACQPEQAAPPRCWERRVVACRSPGRPPLLPSPGRAGPCPASARTGPPATAAAAAATPSLLEMLD